MGYNARNDEIRDNVTRMRRGPRIIAGPESRLRL
jgi:hypothetical protein